MTCWMALALTGWAAFALNPAAIAQSPAAQNESAAIAQPRAEAQPSAAVPSSAALGSSMPAPRPASPAASGLAGPRALLESADLSAGLPPPPSAKDSTIFGGAIRHIDPVQDQFLLDIYGQRPMKVLFDERTQVYRDGVKIPVQDLGPVDHASVQTTLDGSHIFALSVHILSPIPHGEYRGRVLSFNESTGELRLGAALSPQPISVLVPETVTIIRKGQAAFTQAGSGRGDLRPGALVDVTFVPGSGALGIASQIAVLAVPGASFIFSGNLTALDVGSGSLVLLDPRDQKSYRILFSPAAFPIVRDLRVGQLVRVAASFDGTHYTASNISAY